MLQDSPRNTRMGSPTNIISPKKATTTSKPDLSVPNHYTELINMIITFKKENKDLDKEKIKFEYERLAEYVKVILE